MSLTDVRIEEIDEAALLRVIAAQIPEGMHYEYKAALPGSSDNDKKEFLKDVTAMANTRGGHIVFGMQEDGGLPIKTVALPGDIDNGILRLENILRDAIQPRAIGIRFVRVPLASGGAAVVIRVPSSQIAPHRVSFQNVNKYFVRNSAGTHEASVDELRAMFMVGLSNRDRVVQFCKSRVELIQQDNGPIVLRPDGRLIVHLVPLVEIQSDSPVDLARAATSHCFAPMGSGGHNIDYNVDGTIFSRGEPRNGYTQLFRNGSVEATFGGIIVELSGAHIVSAQKIAQLVLHAVPEYARGLALLDVEFPVAVSIALLGVRKCIVGTDESRAQPLYMENLLLPLSAIGQLGSAKEIRATMRLAFNALWNAGAAKDCPLFDD